MTAIKFTSAMRTHVGCRRKLNEDSVLDDTDRALWAVADGMGGHSAGEVASAMVIEALGNCPLSGPLDADADRVQGALEEANRQIFAMAESGEERQTIGSTVVGLVADGQDYVCLWAGDSRAYHVRGSAITQITRDHSLVQALVSSGMLSPDEAESHPNANVITRAIGVNETVAIERTGGRLEPDDILIVASDGLTRLASPDELVAALADSDLERAADRLLALTLEREAPDNVSLILVRAEGLS